MGKNSNRQQDLLARAKQNVAARFVGQDGSVLWLLNVLIEWLHELIVAVNAFIACRAAQRECDESLQEIMNEQSELEQSKTVIGLDDERVKQLNILQAAQLDTRDRGRHARTSEVANE